MPAGRRSSFLLLTAPQLGLLLVTQRKRLKFTQSEVAHRIGLSQNRVSHLERHPEDINVRQLLSWCAALTLDLRLEERPAEEKLSEW
jgi:HTH-type transcriptional regulator / antitoxin HipB